MVKRFLADPYFNQPRENKLEWYEVGPRGLVIVPTWQLAEQVFTFFFFFGIA